ncbi:MAG: hypothetical protein ACD_17C00014G0001 [uncultured bacterium]|nr:MAG: hypothetical protein ACD_17C00014G0001 [uncultured bacterium]
MESDAEGGTNHVIRLATGEAHDLCRVESKRALDAPDPRQIQHLAVPRRGKQPANPFEWSFLNGPTDQQFTDNLSTIDRFNAEVRKLASKKPEAISASLAWFGGESDNLSKAEQRILNVFAEADAKAISLQRCSQKTLTLIFLIGWIMVAAFDYYSNIYGHFFILGIYIVGLFVASAIYIFDRSMKIYTRCLDYRGLAEGLRVQLFYHLAGVPSQAADHYLRKQRNELTWIRQAMTALDLGQRRTKLRFDYVKKYWINDQMAYFKSASCRDRRKFYRNKNLAICFFVVGLTFAFFGFLIEFWTDGIHHDTIWMHWIIALMAFLPATAAVLTGYSDRRGLGQHTKQYEKMYEIFSRAAAIINSLDETEDIATLQRIVGELGKESLSENADWILLHRERPISLPGR